MSEILSTKTAASKLETAAINSEEIISIRVSPNSYFVVLFLTTFLTGFLVYLEQDLIALALFVMSWLCFPILAWTDRVVFDGKRLTRTGFLPRIWAWTNSTNFRLKISDIEQVESQALPTLKRGGNVFYRYRTTLQGKGLKFAFASGGEDYRQMIHKIFPLLSDNTLDNRSIELRDYLTEPKKTLMKAASARIPSAEVLENSLSEFQAADKHRRTNSNIKDVGEEESEKADYLHRLANELRMSGYLLQSLEAFRRALVLNPKDAWLIFDFARCLHSFAGSEKSEKLRRKSFAALRLAETRGKTDGDFLTRLGESYFQYGDPQRAAAVFQRAIDTADASFRSVRGLAEIALREGKIAYVILHFATANRLAETTALRRWTKNENEYFSRLNSDEDYMDLEISRVNLLESLESSKKTCLKIAFIGFPAIIIGLLSDELVTNIGWAISCVSLLIWVGLIVSQNLLSARVPIDFNNDEE
ncbi:MAG: tetratricopeptide repeat protein [Acidobacteriota bacterium]|nr:tetratricopeptide repeat protein [Acidobacteriota bacterium]